MPIDIPPTTFTSTCIITKIDIKVTELILFQRITLSILYIDNYGNYIYNSNLPFSLVIEADEYNLWGQDDSYITQKVMEKIGLASTVN